MEVFLTGSCWNDAVAMAAALKSLELSEREEVAKSVLEKGRQLTEGLERTAAKHGKTLRMTGPSSMPYPWFEGDTNLFEIQKFCQIWRRGRYLFSSSPQLVCRKCPRFKIDRASPLRRRQGPRANGSPGKRLVEFFGEEADQEPLVRFAFQNRILQSPNQVLELFHGQIQFLVLQRGTGRDLWENRECEIPKKARHVRVRK